MTLLLNFYIAQLEHNGLDLKSVSFVEKIDPIFTKGRAVGRDLVQEMYGDASSLRVVPPLLTIRSVLQEFQAQWLKPSEIVYHSHQVFHEIPGKRWDALTHL